MGFLAQQRSCRARGLSVLCTRKCNSPGPLPDLALTQSLTWPPSALTDHFTQVPGSQVLLRVFEVLSGDAGDLPFYGWKRMAHSGLTLLSLPFSLSLIPLNWGPLLASAELPICDRWPKQGSLLRQELEGWVFRG